MKVDFFTDTYFPQASGVATSIETLKDELERHDHEVYIFMTTGPNATDFEEGVIRMSSVPFASFEDHRVVIHGMWCVYLIARELESDLTHTHTEFGTSILGKMVGRKMRIPVIHIYYTMCGGYLRYIVKGKVVRPSYAKFFSGVFTGHTTGVVCPSERVVEKLRGYGVTAPMGIIPAGIEIDKFSRPDITGEMIAGMRQQLDIEEQQTMLLSLSRISYEKNIQTVIQGLPQIIEKLPRTHLVIVGSGPYLEDLKGLAEELEVSEYVQFTGEMPSKEVAIYYKAADYFVSASASKTQGLTYTEAMAAGAQCVAEGNAYLNNLFGHEGLGKTFKTDNDFTPTLIDYIRANIKMDQTILDEKLFGISSISFDNEVIESYQDTLIYFDQLQMEKENADSIKRIKVKFTSLRKQTAKPSSFVYTGGGEFSILRTEEATISKIGFIGTGVMGKSIIRNMMKNNLSVNVYNRTRSETDGLVAEGTVWYDTPKAVTEAGDVISTMVGFPSNVEGAYFDETGIFQADPTDKIVVDLTTSTPTLTERTAKGAAGVGAHVLDSPVSGGNLGAKNGTLTIMVGGDQGSYETVLPIFKIFDKIFMLHGSAGKGQHTKMANQLVIIGTMTGLTEMLIYADATGLTLEKALGAIGGGNAANWSLNNYGSRILKEDYMSGFFVKHFIGDLRITLDETEKLDLTLPMTQKATELYESLADKGFENDGTQALIKL